MTPSNTSVLLIYTGGTIGMIENTETGALENFNFEQLQNMSPNYGNLTARSTLISLILPWTHQTWNRRHGANW